MRYTTRLKPVMLYKRKAYIKSIYKIRFSHSNQLQQSLIVHYNNTVSKATSNAAHIPITTWIKSSYRKVADPFLIVSLCWKAAVTKGKHFVDNCYTPTQLYSLPCYNSLVRTLSLTQQATKLSKTIFPSVAKCLTMAPMAWGLRL